MDMIQTDKSFVKKLEEQEIKYWSDYFLYSSSRVKEKLGIGTNLFAGAFSCTLSKIDTLFLNRVLGLGIEQDINPELISEIIEFYNSAGTPRFFVHESPAAIQDNIAELLTKSGFVHHNNWAKLFKKLNNKMPEVAPEIAVEEITLMDAGLYEELIENAFELEGGSSMLFSQTIGRPGWKHYTAHYEGKPIAAGALYYKGDTASLAIAGTLPDYRGLGAQGAMVTRRLNDARDLGCTTAVVETAQDTIDKPAPSYRNMLRYGFELAYIRRNYIYSF